MTTTEAREDLSGSTTTRRRSGTGGCSARRTHASSAGWVATSTTSRCPGCCAWRSSARRSRPDRQHRLPPPGHPKVKAVVTGTDLAARGRGCRPCPTTFRPCWPPTRSAPRGRGRVRRGGGPLLGARRARADRRGVRRPAAGDRRTSRPRAGRPGDPRRPRGEGRQPLLRLADRRRGGDRGGLQPWGRRGGVAGPRLPARPLPAPMETCGCVADYQRVERPAHVVDDRQGRTRTGPSTRWSPACPSTRSG